MKCSWAMKVKNTRDPNGLLADKNRFLKKGTRSKNKKEIGKIRISILC